MLRSEVKTADVRETLQVGSKRYLELLMKALNDVDNEDDDTPMEQICVRVKLSMAALKLHHSKIDHFALQKEALREHKKSMLKWISDNNVKKPTLRALMREGKKRATMEWLPENFSCSANWAQNLRYGIESRSKKHLPARLLPFTRWLEKKLEEDGNVSNSDAKAKYTGLWGGGRQRIRNNGAISVHG